MKIYKYTNVEHVLSSLKNGLFAGKLTDFNDPYEYDGIRYVDDYRVCCATESSKKLLMWAYYGNHRQCCIEYEVPDDLEIIRKVHYTKNYYSKRDSDNTQIFDDLYIKAYEWNAEKEIRIVCHIPTMDKNLWKEENGSYFFRAKALSLILGLQVDIHSDGVQRILKWIKKNNEESESKIDVLQCRITSHRYGIEFDKQFDYLREINK